MSHRDIDEVWVAASADRPVTWRDLATRPPPALSPDADDGTQGKQQLSASPVTLHIRRIVSNYLKLLKGW